MAATVRPSDRSPDLAAQRPAQYVVVARRYRPQRFEELIGQEHIARALSNAIGTQRVGHAYLFTGARGVGKTSTARILAKALNCVHGPTSTPCNECDLCRSISSGEDVDVLEIDGASNRGIDEIRQLRQNVNVRPSRARFKVYIIDEVHMLTREAFNALLKTLEEPPEHVKFIFCTTEPSKIPITILSRCQRFDFAGIRSGSISERLAQIVETEGVSAEREALEVLARRAAGSMRDAQSLLEQLLAFAPEHITLADVHHMLGTAGDERLSSVIKHLIDRNAAAGLAELDAAAQEGVDLSQLLEQLLGYLRDCMAAAVGCSSETFLYSSPSSREYVIGAGKQLGLETILAAMQILDQALARMRYSTQGRILAELALVRICSLENLEELSNLIADSSTLSSRITPPLSEAIRPAIVSTAVSDAGVKKKAELAADRDEPPPPPPPVSATASPVAFHEENLAGLWQQVLEKMPGIIAGQAKDYQRLAILAPNKLVVQFKPGYTFAKSLCEKPDQVAKFEQVLAELTGQVVRVQFTIAEGEPQAETPVVPVRTVSSHVRLMEITQHPLVRRAGELFGARPIRVDEAPNQSGGG
jgi:DNA polymerase-3 subunit gamma/tau